MSNPNQQSRLALPVSCNMPDLSGVFNQVILNLILNLMFGHHHIADDKTRSLVINYIRLVDKALLEYESARIMLMTVVTSEQTQFGPYFRAIGHMETCIATMIRAARFAKLLCTSPLKQDVLSQVTSLSVLSLSVDKRLRDIRNAMEHMDEDIAKGKAPVGTLTTLFMTSDHVELDVASIRYRVEYAELTSWLKQLYVLSEKLAVYKDG